MLAGRAVALYEVGRGHLMPAFIPRLRDRCRPTAALVTDELLLPVVEYLERPDNRLGDQPEAARDGSPQHSCHARPTRTLLGPIARTGNGADFDGSHGARSHAARERDERAQMTVGPGPGTAIRTSQASRSSITRLPTIGALRCGS